ncbi:MAG: hypothetical protein CVU11_00920 [Bacteroidetes bacterium HGW-Bacteroidetes-6]|jgi:hypothetical protein|nr:MAG: hypothetical protein CVU11_00920 [Bacteroidetes bacterium HGW-Bacteroidetes-6]
MKKMFIFIALVCGSISLAISQVNPHAIGVRLAGDGDANGAEISYQHGFGEANRLEMDLGFSGNSNSNRMFLAGIYHWDWNLTGGLNWFVGPGAVIGMYSHDFHDDYIGVGVGGQIGLEYDFNKHNAPILLSLDFRPMWDLLGDYSGFGWGAALGVRYTW